MKRWLVLILSFLYLGASTGTTLHLHYCMGKLVNGKIAHNDTSKCSKCGMKKDRAAKKGCCKDEHQFVKIEKDQQAAKQLSVPDHFIAFTPVSFFEIPGQALPVVAIVEAVSHAPPRTPKVHPHILYCSFLI